MRFKNYYIVVYLLLVIHSIQADVSSKETKLPEYTIEQKFEFLLGGKCGRVFPLTKDIQMSSGDGFGVYIGRRFLNNTSLRISYFISTHNVDTILGTVLHRTKMKFWGTTLDLRYFFMSPKKFQPYLSWGIGLYRLEDGNENILTGLGLNCGVGFEYFIGKNFYIGSEVILYPFSYGDCIVKNENAQLIDEEINGNMLSLSISATYRFNILCLCCFWAGI
jgi:hypothetical protein